MIMNVSGTVADISDLFKYEAVLTPTWNKSVDYVNVPYIATGIMFWLECNHSNFTNVSVLCGIATQFCCAGL